MRLADRKEKASVSPYSVTETQYLPRLPERGFPRKRPWGATLVLALLVALFFIVDGHDLEDISSMDNAPAQHLPDAEDTRHHAYTTVQNKEVTVRDSISYTLQAISENEPQGIPGQPMGRSAPTPVPPPPQPLDRSESSPLFAASLASTEQIPATPDDAVEGVTRFTKGGISTAQGIEARTVDSDRVPQATLRVKPSPWGNIYLDGEPLAYEIDYWYAFTVTAQRHTLTIRNPTLGRIWSQDVVLTPGERRDISVDFMARLSVNVAAKDTAGRPVSGEIYVDGVPTGDWSPRKIEVYPGTHRIEVRADGYAQLEMKEVREEGVIPVPNPGPFNPSASPRIMHVILKKTIDR